MSKLHEGRAVLVTGAAGGIGRACAELFAREGARVAVVDVDVEGGEETAARIERAGGDALMLAVDLTDEAAVAGMVERAVSQFGRLDSAVNNAGISQPATPIHEVSAEAWQRLIAINQTAVFWCLKHEIRQMLGQDPIDGFRGTIVNTASGAGLIPAPGQIDYTAAKHAVVGMTRSVASEYVRQGIRCNTICPGLTDTPMLRKAIEDNGPEFEKLMKQVSPRGEFMAPLEVAETAVWLCSARASSVNGQAIVTDGGGVLH
jgi:NAD(P)-dependent dehydrogenase (short-subunit alcohol dehydrogenase family)